jgi:hypothetical protein
MDEEIEDVHCYYTKIYQMLHENNFLQYDQLLDNFQQIWIKKLNKYTLKNFALS